MSYTGLSIIKEKWAKLSKSTLYNVSIKKRKENSERRNSQEKLTTNIFVFL